MNYYPHHIGDYLRDTAHLSLVEHGAYRRMLDVYYATEKPLPKPQGQIYRLVGAKTNAEKLAVDVVLGEFWLESDAGWKNTRADSEIAKAQEKSEKARTSAGHRWHSERITDALRPQSEGNAPNNQEPIANNQKKKLLASSANALSANGSAVAYIPLNDGTEFGVSEELSAELQKLYPAVDVSQTLNEVRGWNLANPNRRKTKRGILQHINQWMSKEQNRGPKG